MSQPNPNVLVIVVDDQRPDTIAALGNPHIHTPNLDRLATEGAALLSYTTVPVCTPGRGELLSGADGYRNGCRWFGQPLNDRYTLLPRAFQQAGYHTCHVGKWHNNGHPSDPDKGYDQAHRVFSQDVVGGYKGRGYWQANEVVFEENGQTIAGHSTEVLTQKAIDFVRQPQRSDQPWFCYLALHSPHDPRIAAEPYRSMYDPAALPLPANYMPEHPFDNGDMAIRDERLEAFPRQPQRIQQHLADYYAMITHHDAWIGHLLDALEASGQFDNTVVAFTADHGLAIGSHGLMGKENLYEHSHSVATLIRGPGVPTPSSGPAPHHRLPRMQHYDLMPTLCELANIPTPDSVEGQSVLPALREDESPRAAVFGSYRDCMRSIRTDRWKLIHYPHNQVTQLFDLHHDPDEASNLLAPWRLAQPEADDASGEIHTPNADGQYPAWPQQDQPPAKLKTIAADLAGQLSDWLEQCQDPCPTLQVLMRPNAGGRPLNGGPVHDGG